VNALDSFDSLVDILKDKGYHTVAFHGNVKEFFYRDKAYEELGFDRFYSRKDFDESIMVFPDVESTLGINDYDFFLQSAELLRQIEEPFFAFLITVSSHTPFDFYPEQMKVEEFEDIQNPLVKGYFNSASFMDSSLEMFFSKLHEYELLDDSLIIVYSDHDAGIEKEEYSSESKFMVSRPVKSPESIPLFIIHDDLEPMISSKEGSHTNLAPTVLDLMEEIHRPPEFMGYSLLNPIDMPVLFLHELPQLLQDGQLYVLSPTGDLEHIGYDTTIGERETVVHTDDYLLMLQYLRDVVFSRRADEPLF